MGAWTEEDDEDSSSAEDVGDRKNESYVFSPLAKVPVYPLMSSLNLTWIDETSLRVEGK